MKTETLWKIKKGVTYGLGAFGGWLVARMAYKAGEQNTAFGLVGEILEEGERFENEDGTKGYRFAAENDNLAAEIELSTHNDDQMTKWDQTRAFLNK